jgi:hypothetical protein
LRGPRLIECADYNEEALDQPHDGWSVMVDAAANHDVTQVRATEIKERQWAHQKTRLDAEDRVRPILQAQGSIATSASRAPSNPIVNCYSQSTYAGTSPAIRGHKQGLGIQDVDLPKSLACERVTEVSCVLCSMMMCAKSSVYPALITTLSFNTGKCRDGDEIRMADITFWYRV